MYTGHQLKKTGDIPAAFEGILWLLGKYMGAVRAAHVAHRYGAPLVAAAVA